MEEDIADLADLIAGVGVQLPVDEMIDGLIGHACLQGPAGHATWFPSPPTLLGVSGPRSYRNDFVI